MPKTYTVKKAKVTRSYGILGNCSRLANGYHMRSSGLMVRQSRTTTISFISQTVQYQVIVNVLRDQKIERSCRKGRISYRPSRQQYISGMKTAVC